MVYTQCMDDKMQPFLMALYVALDKLEELDPSTADEDWFRLIEQTVDSVFAPYGEKAAKAYRELH